VMIDFLNKHSTISNKQEIEVLQAKISETAKKTNIDALPFYRPLTLAKVADCVKLLGEATRQERSMNVVELLSDR
jgi:hypothetical protein